MVCSRLSTYWPEGQHTLHTSHWNWRSERTCRSVQTVKTARLPNGHNQPRSAKPWLQTGYEWATDGLQHQENKKALVSEGFSDKQVLDLVGCAGKI